MEFRTRKELVGKRFLSVSASNSNTNSSNTSKLKFSKIRSWNWKKGVIRAVSSRDSESSDLNVLVEYDDTHWKRREWLKIFSLFQLFMVESIVCLVRRRDPRETSSDILWPALRYTAIIDKVGLLNSHAEPVEFLVDHILDFIPSTKITNFPTKDSPCLEALHKYADVEKAVKDWIDYQDGQHILLTTPAVLAGCRVSVYRREGTTQWYTAIIKTFNEPLQTLSVISDTVLQQNDEDPATIQMQLIDDGIIDSILRGGSTPRRRSRNCKDKEINYCYNNSSQSGATSSPLSQTSPAVSELPKVLSRHSQLRQRRPIAHPESLSIKDNLHGEESRDTARTRKSRKRANSKNNAREESSINDERSNADESKQSRIPIIVDSVCRNNSLGPVECLDTLTRSDSVASLTESPSRSTSDKCVESPASNNSLDSVEKISGNHISLVTRSDSANKSSVNETARPPVSKSSDVPGDHIGSIEDREPRVSVCESVISDSQSVNDASDSCVRDNRTVDSGSNRRVSDAKCEDGVNVNRESVNDSVDDDSMHYQKQHLLSLETTPLSTQSVTQHGTLSANIDVTRSVTDQIAELTNARQQYEKNAGGEYSLRHLNTNFNEASNLDGKRIDGTSSKQHQKVSDGRDYYMNNTKEIYSNGRSNVSPSNSRSSAGGYSDTDRRSSPAASPLVYNKHDVLNPYMDAELMRKNAIFSSAFTPHKTVTPPATQSPYSGMHSSHGSSSLLQSRQQQLLMQSYSAHPLSLQHGATLTPLELAAMQQQQQHLAHIAQYQNTAHLLQMSPYATAAAANNAQLELLWRQKYPTVPVPSPWMLAKHHDDLLTGTILREKEMEERERRLERERKDRETVEHDRVTAEHERLEREKAEKERSDRDRQEREKQEKIRLEREREQRHNRERILKESVEAQAAVNHHFDQSLRLAGCKSGSKSMWPSKPSITLGTGRGASDQPKPSGQHHSALPGQSDRKPEEKLKQEQELLDYMRSYGYAPASYPDLRNPLTERDILLHQQQVEAEKQVQAMKHEEVLKQQQQFHKSQQKAAERYLTDNREQSSPSSRSVAVTSNDPKPHYNQPYSYAGYPKSANAMTTSTVTTSSLSVSTSAMRPAKNAAELNFSLYGYQPFQHSYIPSSKLQMHKDDKSSDSIHVSSAISHPGKHRNSPAVADPKYGSVIADSRLKESHLPVPHTSPGLGRSTEAWSSPSSGRSSTESSAFPSSSPPTSRQPPPNLISQQHAAVAAGFSNPSAFKTMDGAKSTGIKPQSPLHVASPQQLSAAVVSPIEKEVSSNRKSSPHYPQPHMTSPYQQHPSGQQVPVTIVSTPNNYLAPQGNAPNTTYGSAAGPPCASPHQYPPHLVPQTLPRPVPSTGDATAVDQSVYRKHKPHKERDKDSPSKKKRKSQMAPAATMSLSVSSSLSLPVSTTAIPHGHVTTTASNVTPTSTASTGPLVRGGFPSLYGSYTPSNAPPLQFNSFKAIVDNTVQAAFMHDQQLQHGSIATVATTAAAVVSQPSPAVKPTVPSLIGRTENYTPPKVYGKIECSANIQQQQQCATTHQNRTDPSAAAAAPTFSHSPISGNNQANLLRASSSASIMETINRVANGIIDTDSDTLSAPSPTNKTAETSGIAVATTAAAAATASTAFMPGSNRPKNFKKAWLQRHSDEDRERKASSEPSLEHNETKPDVKNCYVNCSYISPSKDPVAKPSLDYISSTTGIEAETIPTDKCEAPTITAEPIKQEPSVTEVAAADDTAMAVDGGDTQDKKRKKKRKQKSSQKRLKGEADGDIQESTAADEDSVADVKQMKMEPDESKPDTPPPTIVPANKSKESTSVHDRLKVVQTMNNSEGDNSDASTAADGEKGEDGMTTTKREKKRSRKSKNVKKEVKNEAVGSNFNKPLNRQSLAELKKSCEPFLQDGSCCDVTPRLMKCRECKMTPTQRSKKLPNIFCRFYAFRKLQYSEKGFLTIHGFSKVEDAESDDVEPWLPRLPQSQPKLNVDTAKYIIQYMGELMCSLVRQEMAARSSSPDSGKITWKRAVTGVREMCDVCDTTLFNIHWVCYRCGFVVCIDCYKVRVQRDRGDDGDDVEDLEWLKCSSNRQVHEPDKLMLTQIIPSDALKQIDDQIHMIRDQWGIKYSCSCGRSRAEDGANKRINGLFPIPAICHKSDKSRMVNGIVDDHPTPKRSKRTSPSVPRMVNGDCSSPDQPDSYETSSPLNILADVASSKCAESDKMPPVSNSDDKTSGCATLRDLLTKARSSSRENGKRRNRSKNAAIAPGNNNNSLDDVIKSVVMQNLPNLQKDASLSSLPSETLTNYMPRLKGSLTKCPVHIPVQNLTETSIKYPDIPHSWLCNGRLLRLHSARYPGDLKIFQEQWRRGQPVLVSGVQNSLRRDIWRPTAFSKQFGHIENDLVDTRTGVVHVGYEMKHFWDGFDFLSKRLKESNDEPMLLKLKDWPSGEDFRDTMPSRFADLMNAIPFPEYTRRDGVFNLAARLPDFLVRPDLGPKMYTAYGSACFPKEGTTNLHLDISDAVNIMVYVGTPSDGPGGKAVHQAAASKAIDDVGCDEITKKRVKDCHEIPGAIWHLYDAQDCNKIRDLLNKVMKEQGEQVELHHDPIHDQSWYLDETLRERLKKEYGVEGYTIVQCLGDAVFIPSGAAHQVRNLHSCIKVAEDFVSPENLAHCFQMTQEFRFLSETHSNHEDKLQVKNIVFHAVKDAITALNDTSDTS